MQNCLNLRISIDALNAHIVFCWSLDFLFRPHFGLLTIEHLEVQKLGLCFFFDDSLLCEYFVQEFPLSTAFRIAEEVEKYDLVEFEAFRLINCQTEDVS